jgi:hypothetical protein
MRSDGAVDLPLLAQVTSRELGLQAERLHGSYRDRRASVARRELTRRAVLENDVKPADVARYLGIRPASVTVHLGYCVAGVPTETKELRASPGPRLTRSFPRRCRRDEIA